MTGPLPVPMAAFDALPAPEAAGMLVSACGSRAWVSAMVARRPFGTLDRLLAVADEVWWSLEPRSWLEAFAHQPRIGERHAAASQGERARAWSAQEQSAAASAATDVRLALAQGNAEYERRFGHVYLVYAAGRTADEMLALLRRRMSNDPETELRVAATEQAKITRLRLTKMIASDLSHAGGA